MKIAIVEGTRIEDTWFKAIRACVELGHNYVIDKGEYEGQQRREFDFVTLKLRTPGVRPLACQSQYITPTTDEKIRDYFLEYIMNPNFSNPEEAKYNEYKYATWIAPAWERCCNDLLQGMGGCNQACISVGSAMHVRQIPNLVEDKKTGLFNVEGEKTIYEDKVFKHPPCLRLIDMRVRYGKLHFIIYFRSWDLVGGFPENMGGIQLLKEWCLDYMNAELASQGKEQLKDGDLIASSKGLHIYDHYWEMTSEYVGEEGSALDIPGIHIIGE